MALDRYRFENWLKRFERSYRTLNRVEISESAIKNNLQVMADLNPGRTVFPVLKSNAYGHGLEAVLMILKDVGLDYVAVDGYFEALTIRRMVPHQSVLVMGYIHPDNFRNLRADGMTFVVHDQPTIQAIADTKRPTKIHLELNTGMNRHGIQPKELPQYLELISRYPNLELEGVMSHLADADGESDLYTARQTELFDKAVEYIKKKGFDPGFIHLAQTAGSLRSKSQTANAFRLGIGLYGITPLPAVGIGESLTKLQPVLTLKSTIAKVIELKPGERVSYNGHFTAKRPTRIGVLPLGYYEGVPRALSNRGVVKFGTHFLPIAGTVCMNHTMVDLTGTEAKYGDELVVISGDPRDQNSVVQIAERHKLHRYELVTRLNEHVRRAVVD